MTLFEAQKLKLAGVYVTPSGAMLLTRPMRMPQPQRSPQKKWENCPVAPKRDRYRAKKVLQCRPHPANGRIGNVLSHVRLSIVMT